MTGDLAHKEDECSWRVRSTVSWTLDVRVCLYFINVERRLISRINDRRAADIDVYVHVNVCIFYRF